MDEHEHRHSVFGPEAEDSSGDEEAVEAVDPRKERFLWLTNQLRLDVPGKHYGEQ